MKKYFSFIVLAAISFLISIFMLYKISDFNLFKKELLFIELMILLSIVVALKLFYTSKSGDFIASVFFALLSINSLIIFYKFRLVLSGAMLLITLYGLIYFLKARKPKKKKRRKLKRKSEEINKLIPGETKTPKVIIEKKKFVAGKRGAYYYSEGSDGAKRIKRKNRVFFDTKAQARKAGYKGAK